MRSPEHHGSARLYEVNGTTRYTIEYQRRPKSVSIERRGLGRAVIRDQLPMDDKGLMRCLQDGLAPADWYLLLNGKVFFWLTRPRLLRLLKAGTYRREEHDVLEIQTAALIAAYSEKIWFCPMNSGCKPFPHPSGTSSFQRITDYPYSVWKQKRPRGERVVELAIDYAVPDVRQFVKRVVRMRGEKQIAILYEP